MKDKEKQIEEMAKVIENGCANIECTEKCKYHKEEPYLCYCKRSAEKIYNLFYPKDSVVLSKEELKTLLEDKLEITHLSIDEEFKKECEYEIKQASKETAEKIYHKIKIKVLTEDMKEDRPLTLCRFTGFDIMKMAREIVEEFGVVFENGHTTIKE